MKSKVSKIVGLFTVLALSAFAVDAGASIYACSVACKFSNGKVQKFQKIVNTDTDFDYSQYSEDGTYSIFLGQAEELIGKTNQYKENVRAYFVGPYTLDLKYEFSDDRQHYPTGPLDPRSLASGQDGDKKISGSNKFIAISCTKK